MSAVFELDKAGVRRSFAAAAQTYDSLAVMQRQVGDALLVDYQEAVLSGSVLDVGCGTGFLTNRLLQLAESSELIVVDIALPMLQITRGKMNARGQHIHYLCADAELLPLQENSVDWIFSNLALQWCRNMQAVFTEFKRILRPGGRLVFSTFGPQTLKELRLAWQQVDNYTHVNHFYNQQQIVDALQRAGLQEVRLESYCHISQYTSVRALMQELKGIGAHNVTQGRKRRLTGKKELQRMFAAYEKFREDTLLPATFETFLVSSQEAG